MLTLVLTCYQLVLDGLNNIVKLCLLLSKQQGCQLTSPASKFPNLRNTRNRTRDSWDLTQECEPFCRQNLARHLNLIEITLSFSSEFASEGETKKYIQYYSFSNNWALPPLYVSCNNALSYSRLGLF